MRKLTQVEEAKALMMAALDWSVVKWLSEKKRVRKTADKANEALDAAEKQVKDSWNEDLKTAYAGLSPQADNCEPGRSKKRAQPVDSQFTGLAREVKEADERAYRAHMDAEATFDEAERKLSTRLAREGCQKAIQSWELHEKAIRKAEAANASVKAAT